jgi:hypothetical protein
MSYEVSIKRSAEKPPLTQEDFNRIVKEDSSLSGGQREPIIWTDPTSGQKRYINTAPESGELSTDDTRGDDDSICRFLDKLRSIARLLDARVSGEGEDITDPTPTPPRRAGCTSVVVCAVALVALLAFVVVVSLR